MVGIEQENIEWNPWYQPSAKLEKRGIISWEVGGFVLIPDVVIVERRRGCSANPGVL